MSNVCYSPLGRLVDWSIPQTDLGGHVHLWCQKRQIFQNGLQMADHTRTCWYNTSSLRESKICSRSPIYIDRVEVELATTLRFLESTSRRTSPGPQTTPVCSWAGWGGPAYLKSQQSPYFLPQAPWRASWPTASQYGKGTAHHFEWWHQCSKQELYCSSCKSSYHHSEN